MKSSGVTKADIKRAQKKGIWKNYLLGFLAVLIMVYVLSVFIKLAGANTLTEGLEIGI